MSALKYSHTDFDPSDYDNGPEYIGFKEIYSELERSADYGFESKGVTYGFAVVSSVIGSTNHHAEFQLYTDPCNLFCNEEGFVPLVSFDLDNSWSRSELNSVSFTNVRNSYNGPDENIKELAAHMTQFLLTSTIDYEIGTEYMANAGNRTALDPGWTTRLATVDEQESSLKDAVKEWCENIEAELVKILT